MERRTKARTIPPRPHRSLATRVVVLAGATLGVAASASVFACAQIIGADADVVECTLEHAERCNDGDPCTNDSCTRAKCFHDRVPACGISCTSPADCDDGTACTDDICYERRECRHAPKADCAAPCNDASQCDDGSKCTVDKCENGICRNEPLDCSGLDGPCVKGVCSPVTGMCTADPCSTAIDPVTCDTFVCDEPSQQCMPVACEGDNGNPCEQRRCIQGECAVEIIDYGPVQNSSPTDCLYEVECVDGVPLQNTAADFEIPDDDGDIGTIEYCHNYKVLSCEIGASTQPICNGCTTVEDCPPLPCWTIRECDGKGVCRYDGVDGGAADPAGICNEGCVQGGCVNGPLRCFPLEQKCCEGDLCCSPDGCTLDGDDFVCGAGCASTSPCAYPMCSVAGTACTETWTQPDEVRCSGGTCTPSGECAHF